MNRQIESSEALAEFDCQEYFSDGWSESGHFDERSQTQVIVSQSKSYEEQEAAFYAVGRSGAGGIDFGYRKGHKGLWAFYPIERRFKYMAATLEELAHEWCSGRLSV